MFMKHLQKLVPIGVILLGNTAYAFAVAAFILPNHLITGGTTGLALFFNYLAGVPVAAFVGAFNVLMFLLGFWVLGKNFAFTTLLSTFYYPLILSVLQQIPGITQLTRAPMLAVLYAGGLIGVGMGLVIRAGASTGGMDIPPLVLQKKTGIPVSVSLYVFDCVILVLQFFFSNGEQVLYGILVVIIYTFVLDRVLLLGKSQTQVQIISQKYEEINDMIQTRMDRGTTLLTAETGHLRQQIPVVMTVVGNRELPRLSAWVNEIDPKAFLIVSRANEVRGRGFTMGKVYR
nr:YitT family protein [Angelakisella massiliensis]